ncbi:MAG: hypothetical protein SFY96_03405, partial [Planctomycetota bacterium]|nr:hypothetical protein [Planctomycetota bacterium]
MAGFNPARFTRSLWHYALLGGCVALLLALLVYPMLLTIGVGFLSDPTDSKSGFTIRHVAGIFSDPTLVAGLLNSLKIAAGTTTLAIILALPLAVSAALVRFPGQAFFTAC